MWFKRLTLLYQSLGVRIQILASIGLATMSSLDPQKQKVNRIGHRTTVEKVQSISYPVSKAGNKRTRDQFGPASECRGVVATLSGNTNKPTGNDLSSSIPTYQTKQLRASEIENVISECSRLKNGSSVSTEKNDCFNANLRSKCNPLTCISHI